MRRYFRPSEFDSPDEPGSGEQMDPEFMEMLNKARHLAGVPFKITSGVRSKEVNERCGGVKDSAHLKGLACDISTVDSRTRCRVLYGLIQVGFNRIGIGPNFIHVDDDPSKAEDVTWLY